MRTRVIVTLIAAAVAAAAFTAGALAGTKDKPGDPPGKQKKAAKAPKAKHSRESRALFAVLRGRNEVGTDGRRGAGDPDGRGSLEARPRRVGGRQGRVGEALATTSWLTARTCSESIFCTRRS